MTGAGPDILLKWNLRWEGNKKFEIAITTTKQKEPISTGKNLPFEQPALNQ